MKCNLGKSDRIIRFLAGSLFIGLGVYFISWWGAVGGILVFTAAVGWCPLYLPFGLSSCSSKS
ncbi:MAG: DUF2892 domain-containing protein [Nitrospiria bacterium]